MTFNDKLRHVLRDMNRSAVCRRAGVPAPTVNNYLHRGAVPQIDIALKLARALDVDPGWMIDDRRGLPVVRVDSAANDAAAATAATTHAA